MQRPSKYMKAALNEEPGREYTEFPLDFYHLVWIFTICSFAGLVVETVVSYPIDGVWKDRAGLVWGPLSPIYGLAAVLFTVILNPLRHKRLTVLFAVSAFAGGFFEFVAGWFWESAFGIVAWSYADQPFNVMGHTCLGISLVWGLAGFVWLKLLLPVVYDLIDHIPTRIQQTLATAFAVFLAVDVAFTIAAFTCWFDRQAGEPVDTQFQAFFAEHFDDEFMSERFQTMSIYPCLAKR